MRRLLDDGVDPNVCDSGGWAPLHVAAGLNHVEVIELLLAGGADARAQNQAGDTPLHVALGLRHIEAAEALILGGGMTLLELRNGCNRAPLECVPASERDAIVTRLMAEEQQMKAMEPGQAAALAAGA